MTATKVQQIIKHYIKDNNCLIFSKLSCPFCLNSKNFFESKGIRFKAIELDRDPEYQDELEKMTGQRTVPSIWINQKLRLRRVSTVEVQRNNCFN